MGRPIDTHNTIARMADIAKIQNTEQQRDETQRRQFALTLQHEAARKETQVQNTPKSESLEVRRRKHHKERQDRKQKHSRGEPQDPDSEEDDSSDEEQHVDLKID